MSACHCRGMFPEHKSHNCPRCTHLEALHASLSNGQNATPYTQPASVSTFAVTSSPALAPGQQPFQDVNWMRNWDSRPSYIQQADGTSVPQAGTGGLPRPGAYGYTTQVQPTAYTAQVPAYTSAYTAQAPAYSGMAQINGTNVSVPVNSSQPLVRGQQAWVAVDTVSVRNPSAYTNSINMGVHGTFSQSFYQTQPNVFNYSLGGQQPLSQYVPGLPVMGAYNLPMGMLGPMLGQD